MRLLPYGERAVLAEVDDLDAVLALHAALRDRLPDGVEELVPAARTLLVAFDPGRTSPDRLREALERAEPEAAGGAPATGEVVEVPVTYDGPDLDAVAEECGLERDEVVRRHLAGDYVSAFCGFAPGFAYLTGLDESLHVARRDEPRTAVPAGSVALADAFTAVYPRRSPGGWRLIGTSDVDLFDVDRDPPALLVPGTRVRFVAVS